MMTRPATRIAVALCLIPLWVAPAAAQDPDPTRLMAMVGSYLDILDRMGKVSGDPRSALMHATNSIKEVYEQGGRKADAVPELRKILEGWRTPRPAPRCTSRSRTSTRRRDRRRRHWRSCAPS